MKLKTVIIQSLGKLPTVNWEERLNRFILKLRENIIHINFTKQAFSDPLSLTPEHKQVILKTGKTYYTIKSF